jgi:hypothetical protein
MSKQSGGECRTLPRMDHRRSTPSSQPVTSVFCASDRGCHVIDVIGELCPSCRD